MVNRLKNAITIKDNVLIPQHFGSLLYIRKKHEYIPYDRLTTSVLHFCSTASLFNLPAHLSDKMTKGQLKAFFKLGRNLGFMNRQGQFIGTFIEKQSPDNHLLGPLTIHLSITNECDLCCLHCFAAPEMEADHKQLLTYAELDTLFEEAAALGCMRIAITGGEPFNRPDIFQVMDRIFANGLDVCITSNGIRINHEIVEALSQRPYGWINISLEGATAKTNDAVRGKGTFYTVVSNLRKHFKYRLRFGLSITLNSLNIHEIDLFPKLAREVGAEVILLRNMYPIGRGATSGSLALSFTEYQQVIEKMTQWKNKIFMVQTSCEPFHSDNEIATIYENFGCAAGNTVATVYPDGTVSPCSLLGDGIEIDSLRSKSFSTIWHAGKGFQKIRNLAIPYNCLSCDDYQTCSGGCRARAWASYGNIQSSDPWCKKVM